MRFLSSTLSGMFSPAFFDLKWLGVVCMIVLLFYGCDMTSSVEPEQDKTFIKLFGGSGSDKGKDLVVLPNNEGFILVGSSTSIPDRGEEIFIVRADHLGNVVWQKHYGGSGIGNDVGNSVILSQDGSSIYVCGEVTQDTLGNRDVAVLNMNVGDGTLIGNLRTYGQLQRDEFGTDIVELNNGGFIISSTWLNSDSSQYYLIETDLNLDTIPSRSNYVGSDGVNNYSAVSHESFDPVYPFICFGTTYRTVGQGSSFWFHSFRYDGISESLGTIDYYGSPSFEEYCTDAFQTADNGFVLAGIADDGNSRREMIVTITNGQAETGIMDYQNEFNRNVKIEEDSRVRVFQTMDGGYIVSSTLELDAPKNNEMSLLKLNASLEEEWRKTYGSDEDDEASGVVQLEDGSFILVGTIGFEINPNSQSKMCLMKINPIGDLIPL